jgi:hypothetical protein
MQGGAAVERPFPLPHPRPALNLNSPCRTALGSVRWAALLLRAQEGKCRSTRKEGRFRSETVQWRGRGPPSCGPFPSHWSPRSMCAEPHNRRLRASLSG